ncbi:hypothetical protein FACS189473_3940 [Spirochaetia bacterium]|nr:hypothetical protein FACS189473_3940 [Spirochaetia bacterium]
MAIDGTYKIIAKAPMGNQDGTLVYKTEGGVLTGSITVFGTSYPIEDGKLEGTDFEYIVKFKNPMGSTKTTITGTVDGDTITGKMKAMMLTMNFSGTKVSE